MAEDDKGERGGGDRSTENLFDSSSPGEWDVTDFPILITIRIPSTRVGLVEKFLHHALLILFFSLPILLPKIVMKGCEEHVSGLSYIFSACSTNSPHPPTPQRLGGMWEEGDARCRKEGW
ncbi:hypothetical protein CEXT_325771 [Caerostris extrusa]|uniref:Uncharacterized protein n=1 Tax=Caerostris extrusa TaxID=172846 RepID=A0AAV4SBQ8_CAEEX|nr:hypothetical protein CEXT_325771 [Caerostris extrusa]